MMPTVGLIGEQGMIPCRTRVDVIYLSVGNISTLLVPIVVKL